MYTQFMSNLTPSHTASAHGTNGPHVNRRGTGNGFISSDLGCFEVCLSGVELSLSCCLGNLIFSRNCGVNRSLGGVNGGLSFTHGSFSSFDCRGIFFSIGLSGGRCQSIGLGGLGRIGKRRGLCFAFLATFFTSATFVGGITSISGVSYDGVRSCRSLFLSNSHRCDQQGHQAKQGQPKTYSFH